MQHDSGWMFLETDPLTHKSIYVRLVDDKIQVQERIPMWLAQAIIDDNRKRANQFAESGGWKGRKTKKHGAIVAAVPDFIDTHIKNACGYDPTKGGDYDKAKYNAILDDVDYAKLRTSTGKIGKRSTDTRWVSPRIKKLIVGA